MAERLYFGKFEEVIEPPNLIEVQSRSYDEFLQKEHKRALVENLQKAVFVNERKLPLIRAVNHFVQSFLQQRQFILFLQVKTAEQIF